MNPNARKVLARFNLEAALYSETAIASPIERCPSCDLEVKWFSHDDSNIYDCPRYDPSVELPDPAKHCPLKFSERIWFPEGLTNPPLNLGYLEWITFELNGLSCALDFRGNPRFIVDPKFSIGDLKDGAMVFDVPLRK